MLDFFRQRGLSNIIYGAVIAATILAFVITFRPNATSRTASLSEACAARVRGRCIDPKDFSSAYRILMPTRSSSFSRRMNLKRVALDGLIERELLCDEAARLGISATDAEVTDQLYAGFVRVSVPAADPAVAQAIVGEMYQQYMREGLISQDVGSAHMNDRDTALPVDFRDPKTKAFDIKTYERRVRTLSNRSTTEFREEQARELLAAKMRDVVRSPVRVSEEEAWQEYERRYSTATVTFVPVKESWAARWAVDRRPAAVDAWAKDHASEIDQAFDERKGDAKPKAGHIRHILVKLPYGASDEEKALALAKLSSAAARVRAGASFAEVARETSDDTGSAAKGGDVGDSTSGFVAPFRAAADALKPGETTPGAVETQFGYHLITRDDPAKAGEIEAQVKRDTARDLYARAMATDAARTIAARIGDAWRSGKSAEEAIQSQLAALIRDDKAPLLRVLPSADAAADAGAPAAASEPAAKERTAKGSAGKASASQAGAAPAAAARGGLEPGTDPDRPQVQTSKDFNRGGDPFPGLSPEGTASVVGFAFSGKEGDVMAEPVRTADGFAVVAAKQHTAATREQFEKDGQTLEDELLRQKRDEALSLYVKRLRDQAKGDIKIDQAYVQEARPDAGSAQEDEDEY